MSLFWLERLFACGLALSLRWLLSALDVMTEQPLWQHIFSTERWAPTCLAVSHRLTLWQQADQIIVLKDGRVDGGGTVEDLLQSNEEFQQLWQGTAGRARLDQHAT